MGDLMEVDPEISPLPPKDVLIHRIYRDIRLSNDTTPYKRGFSASFSRSGRKGICRFLACYHLLLNPETSLALQPVCGVQGERDRQYTFFGKASPHPKGQRQNIFGHASEDELKVAVEWSDEDDAEDDEENGSDNE
ncbi:hypothetical protein D9611_003664 [Ephemerocybe angulata]|uniref:Uncharacterized protein n=1 Tax=Ephemerocybe angulata TaxID=980116 RepID=A0A8H5B5J0_9AGAR|nr:hypothetical protein D9611_003664 [Tulosesus angulatus]